MKIYLDEPLKNSDGEVVKIEGIPLAYTHEGARYLLSHYEAVAKIATVGPQFTEIALQHLHYTISRIRKCIEYYENISPTTAK